MLRHLLGGMTYAGVRHAEVQGAAPWAFRAEDENASVLYAMRHGSAFLRMGPGDALLLEEGDLAVLPVGRDHVVGEGGDRPVLLDGLLGPAGTGARAAAELGPPGPSASTRLLAVSLRFDGARERALLGLFPRVLRVDAETRAREPAIAGALELVDSELAGDGVVAEVVVARLFDVLMMKTLAAHLRASSAPRGGPRRLLGLDDERVAGALLAMYDRPELAWTVASLAGEAGMSRSVFAERFLRLVGETPLGHLTRFRIERAARALRRGAGVAEAALAVGYRSEAAFSRAFKRALGTTPTDWRREPSGERGGG